MYCSGKILSARQVEEQEGLGGILIVSGTVGNHWYVACKRAMTIIRSDRQFSDLSVIYWMAGLWLDVVPKVGWVRSIIKRHNQASSTRVITRVITLKPAMFITGGVTAAGAARNILELRVIRVGDS